MGCQVIISLIKNPRNGSENISQRQIIKVLNRKHCKNGKHKINTANIIWSRKGIDWKTWGQKENRSSGKNMHLNPEQRQRYYGVPREHIGNI